MRVELLHGPKDGEVLDVPVDMREIVIVDVLPVGFPAEEPSTSEIPQILGRYRRVRAMNKIGYSIYTWQGWDNAE